VNWTAGQVASLVVFFQDSTTKATGKSTGLQSTVPLSGRHITAPVSADGFPDTEITRIGVFTSILAKVISRPGIEKRLRQLIEIEKLPFRNPSDG
jgi:hypothetical protein